MKYKSQTEAILAHLKTHGNITARQSDRLYGASRLSAIIFVLRGRGYRIITEPVPVKTRFGRKTNIGKYILLSENE